MHPDLEKLLDLKAKDEALAAANAAVAAVTDAEAALDERLQRNQKERDSLARLLADVTAKRDELMRRIEALKAQQGKRQQRLDQVKNVREATAVTAEIDLGRQILGREEGDWVQAAEEVTKVEGRLAEADRVLTEARASQSEERDALAARRKDAESARAEALAARQESAGKLDRPLRTRYDRLKGSRSANALMPLTGFACSACYTAVPVSRRGSIRGGLLIEGCEVCGVILYVPEGAGE